MSCVAESYRVASDSVAGRFYVVTRQGTYWDCSCPHRTYRGKRCKHIRRVLQALNIMETRQVDTTA